MITKLSTVILLGLTTTLVNAGQLQDQFLRLHAEIAQRVQSYENGQATAATLSDGDLRQKLFASQSLAQLFSRRYPELKTVELTTKGLEDQIGAFRKTNELLSHAKNINAPPEKIAVLTANRDHELTRLESYFKTNGWIHAPNGALTKMKSIFDNLKWASDKEEQKGTFVLMGNFVDSIAKAEWDMNVLEGGRGIHDLRKQVRWYRLQSNVLTPFIGTHNRGCGNGAVLPAEADGNGRCLVSSCLSERMSRAYDFFGNIKDEGEAAEGVGQHLGAGKFAEAKQFYSALKNDQVFEKLAAELLSCAQQ